MKITNISIEALMEQYNVHGLSMVLIEHGQISRSENYGIRGVNSHKKVKEHSIFNACSMSKFLTGLVAIKLISDGFLDLDEHVNERLVTWKVPENVFTSHRKVTLRSLLSHQSGIKDPQGSFSEIHTDFDVPSMVELLEGKTPYCQAPIAVQCEPESEFHYSDAGFCIIQLLIEDVMKKPYDQVVSEYIFKPLGMENSYLITSSSEINKELCSCGHNKNGEIVPEKYPIYPYPTASGLWTTSLDFGVLVLELINVLKGKSKIGMSEDLVREMIRPQFGKSWTGLGVFLEGADKELQITSMGWGVGFQCMMVAYPYLEKGLVIMTNAELGVHQMDGIIGDIYRSINLK